MTAEEKAKEWFRKGGYLGIDEDKVAEMLVEFAQQNENPRVKELEKRLKDAVSVMEPLSDVSVLEVDCRAILGAWVINSKKLLNK